MFCGVAVSNTHCNQSPLILSGETATFFKSLSDPRFIFALQILGMFQEYDVIVVGAGHAGCEAAAAAANLGSKVLLITMNMQTIAQMSCNPAMGGIAKGQILREIDAMGGYSGIVTDKSMLQFRMLNRSKGPAMWSPRAQSDRMLFSTTWRQMLEETINVDFYQDMVRSIIIKNGEACGVTTGLGHEIFSKAVVVTSGTFLNGIIHIGEKQFGGGRVAEKAATGITEQLVAFGFESGGARARIGLCQCGEQMPHGVTAQLGGRRFPAAHRRGAGGKAHVEPEHVQHPFRVKEVQIGLGAAPVVGEGAGQQSHRAEREREGGDSYVGR